MAQQTQPQQQAAPSISTPASTAAGSSGGAGSSGAAGGGAATPISTPSTPQPVGVSGPSSNNNNNNLVSPSGNNNLLTPVQAFTPAGQPVYNPHVYMSAHGGHPHAGAHYPAMIPAPIPSNNVYVNNVTANVNLHGWPHGVPTYMPAGGQHHYIGHGDMPQEQVGEAGQDQCRRILFGHLNTLLINYIYFANLGALVLKS